MASTQDNNERGFVHVKPPSGVSIAFSYGKAKENTYQI